MSNLRQRGSKASANGADEKTNGRTHKPSLSASSSFLHTHSHSHDGEGDDDHEEHTGEAMMLLEALRGNGDAGSRVTLLGLAANVGLTLLKGAAGWYLNSAALIADAGHSLSDLIADFVTLSTILLAQRPPSKNYPLGYGKFESLGTVTVSIFLLLGGIGIAAHSWGMLSEALASNPNLPPLLLKLLPYLTPSESDHGHGHAPVDEEDLSPTAVLFPLFGILVKEYLYRVTKRVADEQNSSVLMANAMHHRSDAYSSIVTVVAILGSLFIKGAPFDPLGGLFVGFLILMSSVQIFKGAIFELTDASVSLSTQQTYLNLVEQIPKRTIKSVNNLRAIRSGSSVFIDVELTLKPGVSATDIVGIIEDVQAKLKGERREVKEVRVAFHIQPA